jgi:integral membrane protein
VRASTETTAPTTRARAFRAVAIAEAVSWTGLLIGMGFKYLPLLFGGAGNELGVQVFGPIHGGLFIAYLLVTVVVARPLRWDARTVVLALVASIPPLATLWFERWAARTGRLQQRAV